jgi:hypothetical protein
VRGGAGAGQSPSRPPWSRCSAPTSRNTAPHWMGGCSAPPAAGPSRTAPTAPSGRPPAAPRSPPPSKPPPPLRPPPRRRVPVAELRGARHRSRPPRRAQRRRPAQGLRPLHRRPGRHRQQAHLPTPSAPQMTQAPDAAAGHGHCPCPAARSSASWPGAQRARQPCPGGGGTARSILRCSWRDQLMEGDRHVTGEGGFDGAVGSARRRRGDHMIHVIGPRHLAVTRHAGPYLQAGRPARPPHLSAPLLRLAGERKPHHPGAITAQLLHAAAHMVLLDGHLFRLALDRRATPPHPRVKREWPYGTSRVDPD